LAFSLYLGPYQPFLETELSAAVQRFRQSDPLSSLTLLVPNRSLVRHLSEELARKNGSVFNLRVLTLHQYLQECTEEKWIIEGFRSLPESLVSWILKETARRSKSKKGPFAAVEGTPGFYKTLQATLSELRQGAFVPQDILDSSKKVSRDKGRKRLSDKLAEFSGLLIEYEKWKKKYKWKDREDLYADALAIPSSSTSVWTYGFYDASALQRKVLQHLCSARESHWFIPYEEGHPAFEYAKPFVAWAGKQGTVKKVEKYESGKVTALGRLQNQLFKSDDDHSLKQRLDTPHLDPSPERLSQGEAPVYPQNQSQGARGTSAPSPLRGEGWDEGGGSLKFEDSDVKILLCPGEPREVREVVRAVTEEAQRRLTHFSQCGLVLRQFEAYRRMIGPQFENQQVPIPKKPSVFLMETPEAKALLLLLQCFQQEFPRETLMDFLSCPNLNPSGFQLKPGEWDPHLWDQASKEAGVVEGEGAWMDRIKDYFKPRTASLLEEELSTEEAKSLLAFQSKVLQALFDGRHLFDKEKNWAGKVRVLFDLADNIFVPSDAKEQLKTLRRGVDILSQDSFTVEKDELGPLLTGLMEEVKIPWKTSGSGGVEVEDLMQVRGVPFDVLVLPGLVEQGFPKVPRQDPLLLDEERRIINGLHEGKAHIPEKAEGRLEEKLLFLLAVRSARKALILTASHLHPATGAPRVPSAYLHETLRAVTGRRQAQWDGDSPFFRKVAVSDWVREGEAVRVDDLEELFSRFQEAREGNPLPAQAYADGKPFFQEARELLKERQSSRKFTPYDGVFQDAEVIKRLSQEHSLRQKTLSASRLETYAACPLRYFYRYVLGLKVHPEPERVFQLDPAEKGNLMHEVLEETLSRGAKEGWLKARDQEKGHKALAEETQKAFKKFENEGVPGSPALWEWSQFILRKDLERALKKVLEDPDWTPVGFEKAFGRPGQPEVDFKTPAGVFRLEGFMDRVDFSADGKKLRVVDYKTGSNQGFKEDSVKEGTKIQMPLYLWACRTLYPGVLPEQAVYEFVTAKGGYRSTPFDAADWKKVEEPLTALLTTASEAVDQGLFPAAAKACDQCDYRTLCGPGAEKRGERKREDKRVGDYFKLEELP
jgi:ATP-dependent helicase/DNAse subunit B